MHLSRTSRKILLFTITCFGLSQLYFFFHKVESLLMIAAKPIYQWRIQNLQGKLKSQEETLSKFLPTAITCENSECKNYPSYFYPIAVQALGSKTCSSKILKMTSDSQDSLTNITIPSNIPWQKPTELHLFYFLEDSYLQLVADSKASRQRGLFYEVQNECGDQGSFGLKIACAPKNWSSVVFERDCKIQSKILTKLFSETEDRECSDDSDCEIESLTGCGCSSSYYPIVYNRKYHGHFAELISFYRSSFHEGQPICLLNIIPCPKAACKNKLCSIE